MRLKKLKKGLKKGDKVKVAEFEHGLLPDVGEGLIVKQQGSMFCVKFGNYYVDIWCYEDELELDADPFVVFVRRVLNAAKK